MKYEIFIQGYYSRRERFILKFKIMYEILNIYRERERTSFFSRVDRNRTEIERNVFCGYRPRSNGILPVNHTRKLFFCRHPLGRAWWDNFQVTQSVTLQESEHILEKDKPTVLFILLYCIIVFNKFIKFWERGGTLCFVTSWRLHFIS